MERKEFEKLVAAGIDDIPPLFLAKLNNVVITVEDWPSADQARKARLRPGHTLFGLYEGVPQTKRGSGYTLVLPDKITIFQQPIERSTQDPEQIKAIVKNTVWHEIGHHFGLDEPTVRARQANR